MHLIRFLTVVQTLIFFFFFLSPASECDASPHQSLQITSFEVEAGNEQNRQSIGASMVHRWCCTVLPPNAPLPNKQQHINTKFSIMSLHQVCSLLLWVTPWHDFVPGKENNFA